MVGEDAEPEQIQPKDLKSNNQTIIIRDSQGLPEGHIFPKEDLKLDKLEDMESDVLTLDSQGPPEGRTPTLRPKLKVELNTTVMELYHVKPMLCSSMQHFSNGKYPVSDPNSGRPVIIMILEGKSSEPAIDRMMESLIYVALILSAISTALHIDPKTGGRWSLIVN